MLIRSHARVVVAICALVMLSGCSMWLTRPLPGPADTTQVFPSYVRLTMRDGRVLALRDARMKSDSIFGTLERYDDTKVRPPVAVAVADVAQFEKYNHGKRALTVVGAVLIIMVGLIAYGLSTWEMQVM